MSRFVRYTLLATTLALVTLLLTAHGQADPDHPSQSVGSRMSQNHQPLFFPRLYRSPGDTHKVMVSRRDRDVLASLLRHGTQPLVDYGSFHLLQASERALAALEPGQRDRVWIRDEFNLLMLATIPFDTTVGEPPIPPQQRLTAREGKRLHLIQFIGPVKEAWVDALLQAGDVRLVTYLPYNAYVVWADSTALEAIRGLAGLRPFIQWQGPYHPYYKLHPGLKETVQAGEVTVTVQVVRHPDANRSVNLIQELANAVVRQPYEIRQYVNLTVRVPVTQLNRIARLADVFAVEPWQPPRLLDERQGQILAGNLDATGTRPIAPTYLAWLASLGFSTDPADYPIVDVIDDGFDNGSATAPAHADFYLNGDPANPSRVAYARDLTTDGNPHGIGGHGNINIAIVGGYNETGGFPYEDSDGYQRGLGIAPYGRMASSKVFSDAGWWDYYGSNAAMFSGSYVRGARITNHSYGVDNWGDYNTEDQEFDALVRDARPGVPGNQEIVPVVAAGNSGPSYGSTGSPANAKNVITVGASENFRMDGRDGCGYGNSAANNAQDIASFSSRGPTNDWRVKPDIVAPGTHIQGAASQDPQFEGSSVCGGPFNDGYPPPGDAYFPPFQTLYTWSTGTSHSAPAVAGGAALVYYFLENRILGRPPSAAMVKAYLINAARYLTGSGAAGNLPSVSQGWGLMDLGRAFDDTPRLWVDQTVILDGTGDEYTFTGMVADPSKPFRVTLAWTDAPGPTIGAAYVNNLDLDVAVGGTLYHGNHFSGRYSTPGGSPDPINNVEGVYLPPGTTGVFTVTVRGANIPGDGVPNVGDATDQDFALVVYNALPTVRAWKDATSFGLENEHILLHGSQAAGWDWVYLVLRDTGTQWGPLPSGKLQLRAHPGAEGADAFDIVAGSRPDLAYILYSATYGDLTYRTLYILLAGQPFLFMRTWAENSGATATGADLNVQLLTLLGGDLANDRYYVPGQGAGSYTGTGGRTCFSSVTAPFLMAGDQYKGEAAALVRLQAYPGQSCVYDEPFGSGIGFEDTPLTVEPGHQSAPTDVLLVLLSGRAAAVEGEVKSLLDTLRCGNWGLEGVLNVKGLYRVGTQWGRECR